MEEDGYIDEGRKEKRRKTVRKGNKENIYIYTHTHIYIYRKREREGEKEKDKAEEREENRGRWWFVPQGADWGRRTE